MRKGGGALEARFGDATGTTEVRLRVPELVEPAPFQPVVLHVGNLFSQPGVGLAVR